MMIGSTLALITLEALGRDGSLRTDLVWDGMESLLDLVWDMEDLGRSIVLRLASTTYNCRSYSRMVFRRIEEA